MQVIKTSNEDLVPLEGYPFKANFQEVPTENDSPVRMHYVDEGPQDGQPIVLLHGNPTWSYSYRNVIPPLVAAGYRVIAPDLIGLGRSDKPTQIDDYSIRRHISWLTSWFSQLELQQVILVCQDWGGMLGLSIASSDHARFSGIVVTNTGLYYENQLTSDEVRVGVEKWAETARTRADFPYELIFSNSFYTELSASVRESYFSPYYSDDRRSSLRAFPLFIPIVQPTGQETIVESQRTWERLENWHKPMLLAFSDNDPMTGSYAEVFKYRVPGTDEQSHVTIKGGGHVVQEDCPEDLARAITKFAETLRVPDQH